MKNEAVSIAAKDDEEEPWNFSWVVTNELAAMSCPYKKAHILFLDKWSIKHLITLSPDTRPYLDTEIGIQYHEISVQEFQPPTIAQIQEFVGICDIARNKNEAIGVHCRMGRGRTGVMLTCYLIYFFSLNPYRALTNIRLQRPGSVETLSQERVIFEYYDYLRTLK